VHRQDQFTAGIASLDQLLEKTEPILREFFERPADVLAPDLLGTVLLHGETAGMLVETEAYLGLSDLAAHASRGLTKRTQVMFGAAGYAYVYLIYGMHECLNVVAGETGVPHCVLVRAMEPLAGIETMAERRHWNGPLAGLGNGPGKLTRAMGISRSHYGADLCAGPLQLRRWKQRPSFAIEVTPRIGIRHNSDWPMRFVWSRHPSVSRG
jgi:DNA-3-methyladenine glycosylase